MDDVISNFQNQSKIHRKYQYISTFPRSTMRFPSIMISYLAVLLGCVLHTATPFSSINQASRRSNVHLYASAVVGDGFFETFCGDFDNYNQVLTDRQQGMFPREGGGHEHIHCTLVPVSKYERLAAFYFDGNPEKIFRFRFYKCSEDDGSMKLYTLSPPLEGLLRKEMDPTKWPTVYSDYNTGNGDVKIQELPKCDVRWSPDPDPVQHEYALKAFPDRDGHHAVMVYGEAVVDSTMMPGAKILVRDQLSLWDNEFWIHDRGFDPDSMNYIYGNQRGVPYQLQRVCSIQEGERVIAQKDLEWTLGSQWRTEDEYQAKLKAIDGVSSKLNS
jgi:hypothetical protein